MKILVLGGSGLVGSRFIQLKNKDFEIVSPSHQVFDLLNFAHYLGFIKDVSPEVIINFAAYTNVDEAEKEKDQINGLAFKLNVQAPKKLIEIVDELNLHLVHLSTDYVFDGMKSEAPYLEEDTPNPLSWYAKTKYEGEQAVKKGKSYTIARIEMPFSPEYDKKKDFARIFLDLLKNDQKINAIHDQKITPTFVDFGIEAISRLIKQKAKGIYHVASTDHTSPLDFAEEIAKQFNLDASLINGIAFDEYSKTRKAPRPKDSWLDISKFENHFGNNVLKSVEEGITQFKKLIA